MLIWKKYTDCTVYTYRHGEKLSIKIFRVHCFICVNYKWDKDLAKHVAVFPNVDHEKVFENLALYHRCGAK